MLPLAAFPTHYYPATDRMKSCGPVQPNLATWMEAASIAKSSGPRRHGDSGRSKRQEGAVCPSLGSKALQVICPTRRLHVHVARVPLLVSDLAIMCSPRTAMVPDGWSLARLAWSIRVWKRIDRFGGLGMARREVGYTDLAIPIVRHGRYICP